MKKTKAHGEYIRRINNAIKYIAANIDSKPSLDEVASASHFSPFHFHRIFHGITGETVNDFITRKRMELAANRLVCKRELTVTDIAEMGGFSSSANFAKAFKLYFGITPSQLRDPANVESSKIGKIYSKYGKAFDARSLYSQFVTDTVNFNPDKLEKLLMDVKVKQQEAKQVAYLTSPKGYDLDAIFETWDKIINWAQASGIENNESKRFALCHDNPMVTPTDKCRYDATIEIDDSVPVGAPFATQTIPAGSYAVAYYKGDGDKVSNFYMELYANWLPASGFEPDNYPPIAQYLNDSRQDGYVEMNAYIKLKELSA
ncbi:AraC family transcriptional regulator [Marinobacterium sp. CAU 1594]|nr:AraC family transcriptional regulator [Marinobacterium arenosum]